MHALNGDLPSGSFGGRLGSFFYTTVRHTEFAPEWPITPDWAAVVRGLRGSLHLSQAQFATVCGLGRATVERWESRRTVPFRGDALQLLTLVKPHLDNPVQAGQALNAAAAVVLPKLTRPTARYTGRQLVALLKRANHDHTDLGRGLIGALLEAQILVAIEADGDELENTYLLLAGQVRADMAQPPWLVEMINDVQQLPNADRQLVASIARRLAGR
jgi:transcriptional regulator with XRE-family HTH domain